MNATTSFVAILLAAFFALFLFCLLFQHSVTHLHENLHLQTHKHTDSKALQALVAFCRHSKRFSFCISAVLVYVCVRVRLIVPRMQHSTLETTTTKAVLPRAPRHSQPRCALLAALNAATCAHRQPHSSTRISWGGGRLHSNPVSKICFLFFFPISFSFQLFSFSFSFILLFSFLFLLLFAVLYCIVMSPLSLPRAAFQPMLAGTLRQATLAYEWLSLQFGGCSFTVKLVAVARVTRYNGFAKLEAAIKSDTICDIFWVALWHLIETARHSRQSRAQQQDSNLSNWIM